MRVTSLISESRPLTALKHFPATVPAKHSIRINQQWRICFRWDAGTAFEVEIVDYH